MRMGGGSYSGEYLARDGCCRTPLNKLTTNCSDVQPVDNGHLMRVYDKSAGVREKKNSLQGMRNNDNVI